MKQQSKIIWAAATVTLMVTVIVAASLARSSAGRTRPDLAALFSSDDGALTFSRTYTSGRVGPFNIGDSHATIRQRLASQHVLAEDKPQFTNNLPEWSVSLPANSGGYVTYTIAFTADRAASIRATYAILQGL